MTREVVKNDTTASDGNWLKTKDRFFRCANQDTAISFNFIIAAEDPGMPDSDLDTCLSRPCFLILSLLITWLRVRSRNERIIQSLYLAALLTSLVSICTSGNNCIGDIIFMKMGSCPPGIRWSRWFSGEIPGEGDLRNCKEPQHSSGGSPNICTRQTEQERALVDYSVNKIWQELLEEASKLDYVWLGRFFWYGGLIQTSS